MIDKNLRPVRHYAIEPHLDYSLRDAAQAGRLPKDQLRRAILLDEIPADPVDDGREYLVRGRHLQEYVRTLRPLERPRFEGAEDALGFLGVFLAIPLVALLFLAGLEGLPAPAPSEGMLPARPGVGLEERGPLPEAAPAPARVPEGMKLPRDRRRDGFLGW
jgi:hypothetical protein